MASNPTKTNTQQTLLCHTNVNNCEAVESSSSLVGCEKILSLLLTVDRPSSGFFDVTHVLTLTLILIL